MSVVLAALLPALVHLALGARHLNFSDEGYLWYGVQRTAAGEVPLRDFQSYQPGRYHWCAAFTPFLGTGIRGVRAASAVFQGLGLLCALLVVRRFARGAPAQVLCGLLFLAWAFPRHKLFESATASMAAWVAVRLLERPSTARHLAAGVFVGLAGDLGSNLGLYAGLSLGALVALLAWKQPDPGRLRRAGAWAGGVVLGFAPFLAMLAFVPGFAEGFARSVRMVLEHGPNIARPWPWPWRVQSSGLSALGALREWAESAAFLLPVLALPGLMLAVLRARGAELAARAPVLGPSVVGLVFLHHASVNSGAWHLAQCLQPVLLAVLAWGALAARRGLRIATGSALALLTAAFAGTWNPLVVESVGERFVAREVAGERLELPAGQARYLTAVERALARTVGAEPLFVAPNMPALYCVLGKVAPTWWIYFYFPMAPAEQDDLVRELEQRGVRWALVAEGGTKSFQGTHERVWQHLERAWRRVAAPGLPEGLVLFRRE